ncbi:MAG TPA: ABC transporter permease [Puia sp.]|nr:ABC transporter permease [Puia sp.]
MLKNYLRIAFRNLWKHRVFSFINILGLTVGMTAFFLIFSYVKFELSYDSFHSKADRIYRIVSDIKTPTETIHANGPSWAVVPHLNEEFPEIETAARISFASLLVRKGDIKFQEDHTLFADSTFFKIFDFKLVRGNPQTALNEPFSIILSETASKKYFGDSNPIGQMVLLTDGNFNATITGIMKDIPENSQIKGDMLVSMSTVTKKFNPGLDDQWGNYGNRSYVLLKPGTNAKRLEAKFPAFLEKKNGTEMKQLQMFPTLFLEPLRDVYLRSTRDQSKTGNINNVYIFSIIGAFILLIACFNFINLTTARATERAKEVGIRKVIGAAKAQLRKQFIGESVILCLIAYFLSVLLSALMLPLFNQLSGKIISHNIFTHPSYLWMLFLTAIGIGILAGLYPAFILSSFQPVIVLKGRFATSTKGILLRKSLVIAQFTISIALIIGTIVVYNQMNYMRSQDLGFNKEQKLIIDTHGDDAKDALKQAISTLPNVISTSLSGSVPGGDNPGAYSQIENIKGEMQIANLDLYFVDYDYIPQYKMKILAGRSFSRDFASDTTHAMIVNEAAMKMFGYTSPQQIIGKKFSQWGREGTIVGVVKDFHFRSLQEVIKPLSLRIEPRGCGLVSVGINSKNIPATIASIENKWKTLIPHRPFSYYFLDDFFDKQYRSEDRFGKLFLNFAILAIFISCLGLLGLASYSTMQRTKEIGIRKVMGASVPNILNLLSIDFLKLVAISFLIAAPIAWYFMHKWLEGFAYRTNLYWWIFALAAVLGLLITLITISFQAIRAAVANPVKSLRTE